VFTVLSASFVLVFVAEMGDKTQLLAFTLAARFQRPWPILAGILVATLVNHAIAAALGAWISVHVPARWMAIGLGAGFIAFGLWTLVPDTHVEEKKPPRFGPFLTTAVLFFMAEMGDKTQLATAALGARFGSVLLVVAGTTAGMMLADGLAVFGGERIGRVVSPRRMRQIAAILFLATGVWTLAGPWI
jgi:putative Ca2+/H+ antiporter (TMEM165/GDT1 family)